MGSTEPFVTIARLMIVAIVMIAAWAWRKGAQSS
jgi:hypothetical protein